MNKPLACYFAGAVSRKSCNRRVKAEKAALPWLSPLRKQHHRVRLGAPSRKHLFRINGAPRHTL